MKYGRSLAMNSANSDSTNKIEKIHSETYPRRLDLKFCQRRRFRGESFSGRPSGSTARPVGVIAVVSGVSSVSSEVRASMSGLADRKVDARVDQCIGQIGDQVHDQPQQREDVEVGKHDRIIAVEHALEAQQSQPVERKDCFDQQRTGEERVDESAWKPGNH